MLRRFVQTFILFEQRLNWGCITSSYAVIPAAATEASLREAAAPDDDDDHDAQPHTASIFELFVDRNSWQHYQRRPSRCIIVLVLGNSIIFQSSGTSTASPTPVLLVVFVLPA